MVKLDTNNSNDVLELKSALAQAFLLSDNAEIKFYGRLALVLDHKYKDMLGHVVMLDTLNNAPWTSTVCTGRCGKENITEEEFEWLMLQFNQVKDFYKSDVDLEALLC